MRVDELINDLQDMIAEAKSVPLTGGKVLVESEKIYDILDEIQETLPAEVRQAKNIVADRSQIISEAKKEAEDIIRAAEERKKAMIDQSEVMRAAKAEAAELMNDVKAKAAEMRKAANDYVENIMKKTDDAITAQLTELRKTRQNLRITKKSN
ncbi:MAG: ATPase [Oscillospiraceae bacterium]|nr:ATPase [Candidatus Ruminococcus equi]